VKCAQRVTILKVPLTFVSKVLRLTRKGVLGTIFLMNLSLQCLFVIH